MRHFICHEEQCSPVMYVMLLTSGLYGITTLIARFMGPTRGPSGADRTQVGPMLALWTLLSGYVSNIGNIMVMAASYIFVILWCRVEYKYATHWHIWVSWYVSEKLYECIYMCVTASIKSRQKVCNYSGKILELERHSFISFKVSSTTQWWENFLHHRLIWF